MQYPSSQKEKVLKEVIIEDETMTAKTTVIGVCSATFLREKRRRHL